MKKFMKLALLEAEKAREMDEVPVGCVIVKDGTILTKAHNLTTSQNNAIHHAEILAISKACEMLGTANLSGCELYVTLEPCPMCMGAIISSKINLLCYGAYDFNFGACGGYVNLSSHSYANKLEVYGGIMEEECSSLIKDFFVGKRGN